MWTGDRESRVLGRRLVYCSSSQTDRVKIDCERGAERRERERRWEGDERRASTAAAAVAAVVGSRDLVRGTLPLFSMSRVREREERLPVRQSVTAVARVVGLLPSICHIIANYMRTSAADATDAKVHERVGRLGSKSAGRLCQP